MTIYKRLENIDHFWTSDYEKTAPLDKWAIEPLNEFGFDVALYWYAEAPYEGAGEMLGCKNGQWAHISLNHCSCYGPGERQEAVFYPTIQAILNTCTPDARKYIEPLLALLDEDIRV